MSDDTPHGKTPQTLKPFTAAKKLGVHLPATPESFQQAPITRDEFAALQSDPPEWLAELRRTGPHPRPVVAQKLGVTISGLARAGVDDALTTAEIQALLEQKPEWLVVERANMAEVRDEEQRVKDRDAGRAALRAEREREGS
ncbi:hypothetical protein EDF38_2048 [Frigoribacterium sp. PhB160]|uniref:DUF5997 family protein n=1 Tax=Frigoribacterium sp. PhB160 TaxID=2485192 RepID=UPI000F4810BD|nr:DUF5997 family protein [Frigoribacterium sp. PhB160]ROS59205.1 hypothetical protein EDF38_2048 [Frigoribacterium sp. PhB160]